MPGAEVAVPTTAAPSQLGTATAVRSRDGPSMNPGQPGHRSRNRTTCAKKPGVRYAGLACARCRLPLRSAATALALLICTACAGEAPPSPAKEAGGDPAGTKTAVAAMESAAAATIAAGRATIEAAEAAATVVSARETIAAADLTAAALPRAQSTATLVATSAPTAVATNEPTPVAPGTFAVRGGSWIAYVDQGNIWLVDPVGADAVRITEDGAYSYPAWSRDGAQIVAVHGKPCPNGIPNLQVIDLSTGLTRELTQYDDSNRIAHLASPHWSTDGSSIVYGVTDDCLGRYWQIATVGSDGNNPGQRLATPKSRSQWYPAWAPDGVRVSYGLIVQDPVVHRNPDNWGLWVANRDGSQARRLTAGNLGNTSWSSDGQLIAYDHECRYTSDIYLVTSEGDPAGQLTNDGVSCAPDWSPDGRQLVFEHGLWTDTPEVWIMNRDGSDPHKLADGRDPAWQPGKTGGSSDSPALTGDGLLPGSIGDIRWSKPELIGGPEQGGPSQQLLLDRAGRLWAFWEEHVRDKPQVTYTAVHYRIWDGQAWGPLLDIPGSENAGESSATLLGDGSILVAAISAEVSKVLWFRWSDAVWSVVPEMAVRPSPSMIGVGTGGIAADGHGFIHLLGPRAWRWHDSSWTTAIELGSMYYHSAAADAGGDLHVLGSSSQAAEILHWRWDGRSWSAPETVHHLEPGSHASPPHVAIGPDGVLHAVWVGDAGAANGPVPNPRENWLSYSQRVGGKWSAPQTVYGPLKSPSGPGVEHGLSPTPDVTVLPDGTVVIVWSVSAPPDDVLQVYARWGDGRRWAKPVMLSPRDKKGHWMPTIGVDAGGRPHVIWFSWAGVWHVMGSQ